MTDMGNGVLPFHFWVNDSDTICYTITAIDNSGCFNSETFPNNGTCVSFVASQGITFPYCDNFDNQNIWTDSVCNVSSSHWDLGIPTAWPGSAHSSPNIWEVALNAQYANSSQAYLTSPPLSFLGVFNAQIEVWLNANSEQNWDGVRLDYSLDNGTTWAHCWSCWRYFLLAATGIIPLTSTPAVSRDGQVTVLPFQVRQDGLKQCIN